jgi:hypothetical protein
MRLLLAIILPWFQFFTIGRPFAGIICLILQITLIGWIPAAIWSVYASGRSARAVRLYAPLSDEVSVRGRLTWMRRGRQHGRGVPARHAVC